MNSINQIIHSSITMSSREIAALLEKRHDHIIRDIEKMIEALGIDAPKLGGIYGGIYLDAYGREKKEYHLPRDLTITLITGYRTDLRYRIVKRLEELEDQVTRQAQFEREANEPPAPLNEDASTYLELIKEARHCFGKQAAAALWTKLPLPQIPAEVVHSGRLDAHAQNVFDFLVEHYDFTEDFRDAVPASEVYETYSRAASRKAQPFHEFGKSVSKIIQSLNNEFGGKIIDRKKSSSIFYVGLRPRCRYE